MPKVLEQEKGMELQMKQRFGDTRRHIILRESVVLKLKNRRWGS